MTAADTTILRLLAEAWPEGVLPDGYALDEGARLVYHGPAVVDAGAESPGASAWQVRRDGGGVEETRLVPRLLTPPGAAEAAA